MENCPLVGGIDFIRRNNNDTKQEKLYCKGKIVIINRKYKPHLRMLFPFSSLYVKMKLSFSWHHYVFLERHNINLQMYSCGLGDGRSV